MLKAANMRYSKKIISYVAAACVIALLLVHNNRKWNRIHQNKQWAVERDFSSKLLQTQMVAADNNPVQKTDGNSMEYWWNEIEKKVFPQTMPNPDFIFHNKLPKSGSTTMNDILHVLEKRHQFNFMKVSPTEVANEATKDLVDYVNENGGIQKPFFLLKHNLYFNWTEFGAEQPTFINVIRDPLDWITSRYYFARFGWEHNPGCRGMLCNKSQKKLMEEIDECVKLRNHECMHDWDYLKYFCGSQPECIELSTNAHTYEQKVKVAEHAKYNILHNFFVVGILEQFEDTLNVFERLMPSYYEGALNDYTTDRLQSARNQTKTSYKKELSEESKKFLRNGVMKPEVEVYEFAKKIFNLRMQQLNIKPVIKEES